jgi:hypothetical protein
MLLLAGGVLAGGALYPFIGAAAIAVPFAVLITTFILPDLLFPNWVRIECTEHGVTCDDFSQHIYAPWPYVVGLERRDALHRVDVLVDHPRANFSIRLSHPDAEAVIADIERRLRERAAGRPGSAAG